MDNASLILRTLDSHLDKQTRLIVYGRAALQLGFTHPPRDVAESKDVDAIIPLGDLEELSANESFWSAQEATNAALRSRGLYITHLFPADQVFLRHAAAVIPNLAELRDAFERAKPLVRDLVRQRPSG